MDSSYIDFIKEMADISTVKFGKIIKGIDKNEVVDMKEKIDTCINFIKYSDYFNDDDKNKYLKKFIKLSETCFLIAAKDNIRIPMYVDMVGKDYYLNKEGFISVLAPGYVIDSNGDVVIVGDGEANGHLNTFNSYLYNKFGLDKMYSDQVSAAKELVDKNCIVYFGIKTEDVNKYNVSKDGFFFLIIPPLDNLTMDQLGAINCIIKSNTDKNGNSIYPIKVRLFEECYSELDDSTCKYPYDDVACYVNKKLNKVKNSK